MKHLPGYSRRLSLIPSGYIILSLLLLSGTTLRAQEIMNISSGPKPAVTADTGTIRKWIRDGKELQKKSPDSALHILRKALASSIHAKYASGAANALINIGIIYGNNGRYDKSIDYFRQAYPYSKSALNDTGLVADVYNNIGLVYFYLGDYRRSAFYYFCSINEYIRSRDMKNIAREGTRSLALTYSNLAIVFTNLKQYRQSLYYLQCAEQIIQHRKYYNIAPQVLINKATVYVALNELDKALQYDIEALAKSREYHFREAELVANCGIGEIFIKKEMPEKAVPYLKTVIKAGDRSNLYFAATMPYYLLGSAYYKMKDYEQARNYLLLSLKGAERSSLKKEVRDAHSMLASIFTDTKNYSKAIEHYKAYNDIKDNLADEEMSGAISQWEVQYRTAQKDKELARKQTEIEKKNAVIWIISLTTLSLLLLFMGWLKHRQRLQKKKLHILEQEKEIKSLKAMMQGEEKERARLARELHDGIGGRLAAIKMNFSALRNKYEAWYEGGDFKEIMQMLDSTGKEIHETAYNLMPDVLVRYGLQEAVRMHCDTINTKGRLHIDLHIDETLDIPDKSLELSVYRILQELLQNIIKHAEASHVLVQLLMHDDILSILVEDNGKGFNTRDIPKGLGLQNIKYRVDALQGSITIQSGNEKGTMIYIEFQLQKTQNILIA